MTDPSVMNQITTMRLPDGSEVAFVDWVDKPLFSSIDVLAGSTDNEISAFTYVVGDPVSGTSNLTTKRTSTELDTNLSTPGSMASTEEMLVYAIKPQIKEYQLADASTDANTRAFRTLMQPVPSLVRLAVLQAQLNLRLIVTQKVEHEGSLGYYNAGFGPYGSASLQGPDIGSAMPATQGLPSQDAVRAYVIPIHIGGQEKYRCQLTNPEGAALRNGITMAASPGDTATVMHTITIYLDGLYKRPVS